MLLNRIKKDDLIICAELSRLGRNLFMIMEILNICMTKEAKVWPIKDNYRLGDDIQSKVLAFAFGLSAEIEHNLISQRTKEALARLKSEGKPIRRGKGKRNNNLNAICVAKHQYIIRKLQEGMSVPNIAKKSKSLVVYFIVIWPIRESESQPTQQMDDRIEASTNIAGYNRQNLQNYNSAKYDKFYMISRYYNSNIYLLIAQITPQISNQITI